MILLDFFKLWLERQKRLELTIEEFAHQNKDLLVIVCDPKTDVLFAAYNDKQARGKIKSPEGKDLKIVAGIISKSRFHGVIEQFVTSLAEFLAIKMEGSGEFLKWIGGACKAIADKADIVKKAKREQKKKDDELNISGDLPQDIRPVGS